MKKVLITVIALFVALLFTPGKSDAAASENGIGISPALLTNESLLPGSTYTQEFVISRGNATNSVLIEVTIDGDQEVKEWTTLGSEGSFTLAEGVNRSSILVTVAVPESADTGLYEGSLSVKATQEIEGGNVAVLPAVRANISLGIGEELVRDIRVDYARIGDIRSGEDLILLLGLTNHGNVADSIDQVTVTITDIQENEVLALEADVDEEVEPFQSKEVKVNLGSHAELDPNKEYFVGVQVIDENVEVYSDKVSFSVTDDAEETDEENEDDDSSLVSDLWESDRNSVVISIAIIIAVAIIVIYYILRKRDADKEADKHSEEEEVS